MSSQAPAFSFPGSEDLPAVEHRAGDWRLEGAWQEVARGPARVRTLN